MALIHDIFEDLASRKDDEIREQLYDGLFLRMTGTQLLALLEDLIIYRQRPSAEDLNRIEDMMVRTHGDAAEAFIEKRNRDLRQHYVKMATDPVYRDEHK